MRLSGKRGSSCASTAAGGDTVASILQAAKWMRVGKTPNGKRSTMNWIDSPISQ